MMGGGFNNYYRGGGYGRDQGPGRRMYAVGTKSGESGVKSLNGNSLMR